MAGIGVPVTVLTLRAGFQGQKKPRVEAEARMVDWSPTLCSGADDPSPEGFSVFIASGLADRGASGQLGETRLGRAGSGSQAGGSEIYLFKGKKDQLK